MEANFPASRLLFDAFFRTHQTHSVFSRVTQTTRTV